jgi:hypothetical protein
MISAAAALFVVDFAAVYHALIIIIIIILFDVFSFSFSVCWVVQEGVCRMMSSRLTVVQWVIMIHDNQTTNE